MVRPSDKCGIAGTCELPNDAIASPVGEEQVFYKTVESIAHAVTNNFVNPFRKMSEFVDKMRKTPLKIIGVKKKLPHIAQYGNFVCRKASAYKIRSYNLAQGIPRSVIDQFMPHNPKNRDVTWIREEEKLVKYEDALHRPPIDLEKITAKIDSQLKEGDPALVYIVYSGRDHGNNGNRHTVTVEHKIEFGHFKAYIYDDPATKDKGKVLGMLVYSSEAGAFIKYGVDKGRVVARKYALAGVYDNQAKKTEAIERHNRIATKKKKINEI